MFSKNEKTLKLLNKPLRDEYIDKTYKNPDNDSRGLYMTVQMYKKKNPKSYEVISPAGIKFNLPWNFSKETFLKLQSDNRIYWGKNNDSIPRKKVFLSESKGSGNVNLIWDGKNNGYTSDGSSLIEKILVDKNKFLYPKPITLIIQLLKMFDQDIRVLDFFAGSGTTGHAVMELNREDGGNRTFTLVTNNENNIAHDVTYERLYRINNGKGTKEETFKWLEKNEPYKQNLNVFNIEYFDTQLFNDNVNNELIKQTLIKELQDNGITTSTKFEKHLYYDLMSLKPLDNDKEKQNGSN
ncbi:DNA methyltransferase [Mycoplasma sp. HS2188]|uniref:DNA methyltransferase n=1 Tax=Mycoplasma sp. HS2188 TaxID=2976765 RepID=UPI0021AAD1B6|nr:DNA methyltransferase [Mycoplasma sp. HS2188]MCT4469896.1 DNA methyltransferase [Mycoplasma sp. HS2188]